MRERWFLYSSSKISTRFWGVANSRETPGEKAGSESSQSGDIPRKSVYFL